MTEIDELKVCVAYKYEGEMIDCAYPGIDLSKVEPIFETLRPFKDDFKTDNLSDELKDFIQMIERFCGVEVGIIAHSLKEVRLNF